MWLWLRCNGRDLVSVDLKPVGVGFVVCWVGVWVSILVLFGLFVWWFWVGGGVVCCGFVGFGVCCVLFVVFCVLVLFFFCGCGVPSG